MSFLAIYTTASALEDTKMISSRITGVTVYMAGALVTQTGQISVNGGRMNIVFTGISYLIDPKRIHVSCGNENIKILSVLHQLKKTDSETRLPIIKALEDSLDVLNDQLETLTFSKSAFIEEKGLLSANNSLGGQNNGVSVIELQKAADFFRLRLADINKQLIKISSGTQIVQKNIRKTEEKLAELKARLDGSSHEVIVSIFAATPTSVSLTLSYLLNGAGWSPLYDIKVKDINNPIQLEYKAKVFNNTGIDWDNIKLTLSTAEPNKNASKPLMSPWTLSYRQTNLDQEGYLNTLSKKMEYTDKAAPMQQLEERQAKVKKLNITTRFSEIAVSELSVDFEIKEPYTIPSDSKPYTVDIQSYSLPAQYQFFCIPKVDRSAFLLAKVTGWEELNIMEGPANIYYGTNFIGESYIDTRFTGDTLDISLGRDKKVAVTKIKREDSSQKKIIGLNKTESFIYEITVRNNNKDTIEIELQDQLPVSQEGDIIVDVNEISKAEQDPLSGKLTWKLNLEPLETKKLTISFSIKYPRSKSLQIRKYRTISAPSF
jgi:uncharacterized protein (TIGR02231 family)